MVARNANASAVGSGGICVWKESEFSRREDVFIFNLTYKEDTQILLTFNAISKDNVAINRITVQQKSSSSQLWWVTLHNTVIISEYRLDPT